MKKTYLLIMAFIISAFAEVTYAANWQTVTTFAGQGNQTTDYFYIPITEWRITWSYVPKSEYGVVFGFFVYEEGKAPSYITMVLAAENQTSGTTYIHEGTQNYYLLINTANLDYNIEIECDASTIPTRTAPNPVSNPYIYYIVPIGIIIVLILIVALSTKKGKKTTTQLPAPPPS